jgi:hypothetical protein
MADMNLTIHYLEIANLNHLKLAAESIYKDSFEDLLQRSTITMPPTSSKGDFSAQRFPSSWQAQQLSTLPLSRRMDLSSWLGKVCLLTGDPRSEQVVNPEAVIDEVLGLIEASVSIFPSNTGESRFSQ